MKMKNYLLTAIIFTSSFVYSQTGATISGSFTSGGAVRTYTIYVPTMYDGTTPVPLVFNIHGFTGTCAKQTTAEDFRKIADTANFIIVLPQALVDTNRSSHYYGGTSWNFIGTSDPDKVFIMSLLDTIESHYKINTSRVYSTGFSQGAHMTYDLACFYNTRFAAIASVSGGLGFVELSAATLTHPTPIMEIHGTADPLAAYNGSSANPSVDSLIRWWVNYNHCDATATTIGHLPDVADSATVDSSKVIHYVYTGGTNGATVELYKILNGGHQIPSLAPLPIGYGLGNTNQDFTAAKEIWRFFSQYKLAVGIDEHTSNSSDILIYPNPSNGIFRIEVKNNQNVNIIIVNVLGETIAEKKISDTSVTIDLSNYPTGIYFY